MTSPDVEPKSGKPVVHEEVEGRGTHPLGYEIEKPRSDVKVPVNAGGDSGELLGDALGVGEGEADALSVGEGEADGLVVGWPPTPDGV